jgi:hypothetical protein
MDSPAPLPAEVATVLAQPAPRAGSDWEGLEWSNRWHELLARAEAAWARDPAASGWVAELAAQLASWPDERRRLPGEWFERIASGKDDGRAEALGPLFRHLDLSNSGRSVKFQPKKFARFFEHPLVQHLRSLELCNTHLPTPMAELVARSPRLAGLRYLSFDRTQIGSAGVAALARAEHFAGLRELNLYYVDSFGPGLQGAGLPELLQAPFLPQLEALHLGCNKLGRAGAEALAGCARLGRLAFLSLSVDDVGVEGALALLGSPNLPALRLLDLRENPLDEPAQQRLRAAQPELILHFGPIRGALQLPTS